MMKDKLKALFKQDAPPELANEARRHRYEFIHFLDNDYRDAVIQAAMDIPDDKAREQFVKHTWKAYVIAMSTHDIHVIPSRLLVQGINRQALTRFYQTARASCNLDASDANDGNESDTQ